MTQKINTETGDTGWKVALVVLSTGQPQQAFTLKAGYNIIGRKSSATVDIPIPSNDLFMSRKHCSINVIEKPDRSLQCLVNDLNSVNGTFIVGSANRKLHAEDIFVLKTGDTLQLGITKMVIQIHAPAVNLKKPPEEATQPSYRPTVVVC